jgi:hypothetical protein
MMGIAPTFGRFALPVPALARTPSALFEALFEPLIASILAHFRPLDPLRPSRWSGWGLKPGNAF